MTFVESTSEYNLEKRGQERLQSMIEAMKDLVVVVDREQRITAAYGDVLEKCGMQVEQIVGRSMKDFPQDAMECPLHEKMNARALAGETVAYEWPFENHKGAKVIFHTIVSPVFDENGKIFSAIRVTRDITEEKRLQSQLMVSDRMASVGMLAASVAHEVSNPIFVILANLEFAYKEVESLELQFGSLCTKKLRSAVTLAQEAAKRASQIVGDLRSFSRSTSEHQEAIDIHKVLDSACRMAQCEIHSRATLIKDYGKVPFVDSNESRLCQVFLNLLINAAQAIPEGRAHLNQIRLVTKVDASNRVVVEVHDTGSGMSEACKRQLFSPFFTTKPPMMGTGLGLAICLRIVSGLGGEMTVESELGVGSVFRVALLPSSRTSENVPLHHTFEQSERRGCILVIDDDELVGQAMFGALTDLHDVVVVNNAQEALTRINAGQRFDIIFCDMAMPTMTGMDFHQELARVAPGQAEKIIFLTGGAFTSKAQSFLDTVPNVWMEKPFGVALLRAVIAERLS
jgi:PAS domain S-box-containing protein